jgi:hypothetical protein
VIAGQALQQQGRLAIRSRVQDVGRLLVEAHGETRSER